MNYATPLATLMSLRSRPSPHPPLINNINQARGDEKIKYNNQSPMDAEIAQICSLSMI